MVGDSGCREEGRREKERVASYIIMRVGTQIRETRKSLNPIVQRSLCVLLLGCNKNRIQHFAESKTC